MISRPNESPPSLLVRHGVISSRFSMFQILTVCEEEGPYEMQGIATGPSHTPNRDTSPALSVSNPQDINQPSMYSRCDFRGLSHLTGTLLSSGQ